MQLSCRDDDVGSVANTSKTIDSSAIKSVNLLYFAFECITIIDNCFSLCKN